MRIKIALQISEALEYLHSHRVIHFDVKPEQILVRLMPGGSPQNNTRTLAEMSPLISDDPVACDSCDASVRLIDYGTALRFTEGSPYVNAQLENGRRYRGASH